MSLYEHQRKFVFRNPNKALLVWSTGTGKTRAAIEWAHCDSEKHDVLIICPKALRANWLREVKRWTQQDKWTVMTKEEFRRDAKKLPYYDTVIVDEVHYFSGMKSQMHKSLNMYFRRHQTPNRLLLTATPYLSTPWNIFALAALLGYEWSWIDFRYKFFTERFLGRSRRPIIVPKPGIEEEISKLVQSISDVVKLEDCVDVPAQVFETETFELNKDQKDAIEGLFEVNPIVRFTKYHQIENGALKGNEFIEPRFFKNFKLDRIKELAEGHDKIAIVCRYNLQIDMYAKELAGLGKEVLIIRGDVKDRDAVVQKVDILDKCVILINAACSEGYELSSVAMVVFASMDFSYKNYKQLLGRFLRINRLKKNVYLHLITNEGVDLAVYEAVMNKQDFDINIYAKQNEGEGLPSYS